ncbi:hypothetical protein Palpr_0095 [Paludibacter propionicigenes WB4]|uniref:Gliding motility-associated C-terminal domain-containing protein n=1 Tax=Paludibacter propionicigenes (strain DSM 17365 / JCM 13257 / WB4) TaxID=694427 RepID=E4T067_PALPW|nr:gliding motility-associated C-terminal domain-containing protein [Paludibacter propionicigenes]ADQ78257.1 hypothetical protein Palpr_0095 [Paludibacter propionicigenes WB4]
MKLFKLILFLLVANTALGQTYLSFKERPIVPLYTAVDSSVTSVNTTVVSTKKTSYAKAQYVKASAPTSTCVNNIDFENGDFTNWKCYTGTAKTTGTTNYVTWSPTTPVVPVAGRHQITSSASGLDYYGNFPRLCPSGGNYSIQLGNNSTGSQAEKVSCSFTIPADQNNFSIEYYYAVVFQDPNHPYDEQPRFQAKVYDANNSSNIISCASYDFTAASGLPGFNVSTVDHSVLYKPWSAVTINLSGYAGHTVILEFTTEDCTLGRHFGYAYIDVNSTCTSLSSSVSYCQGKSSLTLTAPSGYENYTWWNSDYTQQLGTGQTVTLTPAPVNSGVVNVDLSPYLGFGCRDTAFTNIEVNLPTTSVTNAAICQGSSYLFNGTSYNSTGVYTYNTINVNGCDSTATLNLTVNPLPSASIRGATAVCLNAASPNIVLTGIGGTAPYTFTYNINGGSTQTVSTTIGNSVSISVPTNSPGSLSYNLLSVTDHSSTSCSNPQSGTAVVTVNQPTESTTTASICQGESYTFNGTSYTATGIYTAHLMNKVGCDSLATLNLTVKLPSGSTTTASICQGESYSFNGTNYTSTGIYTAHLTNKVGCDSLATLNLTVKLPSTSTSTASICQGESYLFNGTSYTTTGIYTAHLTNKVGCDSVATLNLTVKLPSSSTTTASICQGESYSFNGTSYTSAGIYTAHLTNKVGCDSLATLNLTVKLPSSSTTTASICQGGSYSFNGTNYTSAGIYTAHLTNKVGCDSLATLNLTVKLPSSSTSTASICQGESYLFNGTSYTTTGIYTAHLTNKVGCDSVATLNLTVKLPSSSTTTASICQGESYTFNGTSYTATGIYTAHLINKVGCDSTATLNLTVKLPSSSTTTASICQGESYSFNGTSYNTTGIYTAHLINKVGCDSVATLNLTVKLPSASTTTASICQGESYSFNGASYASSGIYTAHLTNKVGCDSVATLNLTVKLPSSSTTTASICQGESYSFNGASYASSGIYTAHLTNKVGCDSLATLNLTVKLPSTSTTNASICQGESYSFNGTSYASTGIYTAHLTNKVDCDSVATLNLTVKLPSSSTTTASICQGESYSFNGMSYASTGVYTAHLTNKVGCDSLVTLNLTVKLPSNSTTVASICQGESYSFNGTNYASTGVYTAHLTNKVGCDSLATLNLTVNLPSASTTTASICQGYNYMFNGTVYNATGIYTKHLVNKVGCDSVATLVLTMKVPTTSNTNVAICQGDSYVFNGTTYSSAGTYTKHLINKQGCDSTAILNLTIKLPTSSTTNISICQGDSYIFNGTTYTTAGIYTKRFTNAVGCDSTAILNLRIKLPTTSTTTASICLGDSYTFNGVSYSTTGTYSNHFINSVGCDSTAILKLKVNLPTTSTTTASICQGDSYLFCGVAYTNAGTYIVHTVNAAGCDSTATLNLSIKLPSSSTTVASICQGDSYSFNGKLYSLAGSYVAHLINKVGCDSAATLVLNVKKASSSTTKASICQGGSYYFNGVAYTKTGTYRKHLINAAGCDSLASLVLKVSSPTSSITSLTVCSTRLPLVWNNMKYYESGTHTCPIRFVNASGCDSTASLVLSIKMPTSSVTNATICDGDSYFFNGINYSSAGTYNAYLVDAMGIDSTATLKLTVNPTFSKHNDVLLISGDSYSINGHEYSQSGSYIDVLKTQYGCDSTVVTNVNVIDVPNTITPNGDGYNDTFMKGWHSKIYNRNGILLYDGVDGWNGLYRNKPVSKDTYFYTLYYTTQSSTKIKEGYLMVIP